MSRAAQAGAIVAAIIGSQQGMDECSWCKREFTIPTPVPVGAYWFTVEYGVGPFCSEDCNSNAGEASEQRRYEDFHAGDSALYRHLDSAAQQIKDAGR